MAKRKSSPEAPVNADATPTDAQVAEQPTSDPALDEEQTTANLVAALVKTLGDANHRIIRRKVKVGGVWYHVEVSK